MRKTRENHSLPLMIRFKNIAIQRGIIKLSGVEMPMNLIVFPRPRMYARFWKRDEKLANPAKEPPIGLSIKAYIRERPNGSRKKTQNPKSPGSIKINP
jgi:hypothetical protein